MQYSMEELINHLRSQGFVFQGSEIYGGLANSWDYGPLGAEMKINLKNCWWKFFITHNSYNVGLDSTILMNSKVWQASGHIGHFSDPLIDCRECQSRFRADKLIEAILPAINAGALSNDELMELLSEHRIKCPECGKHNFTNIRQFELMFKTSQGVINDEKSVVYLRPETAQGIFVNFKNIQRSLRLKLPFGVGQIGKAFRNEITPGNFIFRTREFEQMELEFFYSPNDSTNWFEYWLTQIRTFLDKIVGLSSDNYRIREHQQKELAHYSKRTVDIEYLFPFGWGELWGLADRGNYDLTQHQNYSNQDLSYLDQNNDNHKFLPSVIEPSVGVDRLLLAILIDAFAIETVNETDQRVVLHLKPWLAPYEVAIIPLSKQLNNASETLFNTLLQSFKCTYDQTGNIGKRYRRQDAIGTPYCVTYDFQTVEDHAVTVRDRDTMLQERVPFSKLSDYLKQKLNKQ